MMIPDEAGFEVQGYQYWPQRRVVGTQEWKMMSGTNRARATEPYATPYGANYRISLDKADRYWNNKADYEYRVMKRPYGEWEVV